MLTRRSNRMKRPHGSAKTAQPHPASAPRGNAALHALQRLLRDIAEGAPDPADRTWAQQLLGGESACGTQ
jgi:hypothetical protein